ncbi:unnamed protein product [Closterium sp. NIES-53]
MGNYMEAAADSRRAVAVDPRYSKAYSRLGHAFMALGRHHEAIEEGFKKALELDPSNAAHKENLKHHHHPHPPHQHHPTPPPFAFPGGMQFGGFPMPAMGIPGMGVPGMVIPSCSAAMSFLPILLVHQKNNPRKAARV